MQLHSVIVTAYPNVELTEERISLWADMLQDISFEKAQKNLREHILLSAYPPAIADIIRRDPEVFTDYDRLREDTQTYLQQREAWQQKAISCPPEFSRKHLTAGGGELDGV